MVPTKAAHALIIGYHAILFFLKYRENEIVKLYC